MAEHELKGKVAVITGSSRGIGAVTALEMARQGANVVINYSSSKEKAEKVLNKVKATGSEGIIVQADISKLTEAKSLIKTAKKEFGKIDILVNNAGITRDNLLLRMKEKDWDTVMNINLKGVFNCTKAITRLMMKQRSGKIINMTSVVGIMGNAGQANYSASKAGIIGFTKSVAREMATRGITANAVAPGFIESDMTEELSEDVKEEMLSSIPLDKFGSPEDVANLICFLASDKANYINGQVINVDGGMTM